MIDMGRTELLDAMAKAMFNEELMQEASQAPLPADESGSWTSEAGMEAARLRELEMEERKAVREAEERKAIREAEERKAAREAEEKRAAREAEERRAEREEKRAEREAEEWRAEREAKREQEKARMQLEQAKLAHEMKKLKWRLGRTQRARTKRMPVLPYVEIEGHRI